MGEASFKPAATTCWINLFYLVSFVVEYLCFILVFIIIQTIVNPRKVKLYSHTVPTSVHEHLVSDKASHVYNI